jgi:hypothetical protein
MTVMVLTAGVGTLLLGLNGWAQGQGRIEAESESQQAVRIMCQTLREACQVKVDANGLGLTYELPSVDSSGDYVVPPVWDGVTRRIELDGSTLNIVTNGYYRPICTGVILTDPTSSSGTAAYKIFTVPTSGSVKQVTMEVIAQRNSYRSLNLTSRTRETVYLRNVPELTQ